MIMSLCLALVTLSCQLHQADTQTYQTHDTVAVMPRVESYTLESAEPIDADGVTPYLGSGTLIVQRPVPAGDAALRERCTIG